MKKMIPVGLAFVTLFAITSAAQQADIGKLQIIEGRSGVDESGFIRIAGEVRNSSADWVLSIQIAVDILDPAGRPVYVDSIPVAVGEELGQGSYDFVYTERFYLPPGETAAFEYIRDVSKLRGAQYGTHKLRIASARIETNPPRVVIEGLSTRHDDGTLIVSGNIRSIGGAGCYSPEVVIGLYDADGKLFQVRSQHGDDSFQKTLAAGKSVRFTETIYDPLAGATIKAWADCTEPY